MCQWLAQKSSQRVQLLLGVRHVLKPLLRIVDRYRDLFSQLLEDIGDVVLFGSGLVRGLDPDSRIPLASEIILPPSSMRGFMVGLLNFLVILASVGG